VAPVGAGCAGTGGVALSTPQRPAAKQEADFGSRRARRAAPWGELPLGPKMPPVAHGRSGSRPPGRRERSTGEPAGCGLIVTGSLSVILGGHAER
jgi:hypothetical protein